MTESPDRGRGIKRKRSRRSKNVAGSPMAYEPFPNSNDDNTTPEEEMPLLNEGMKKGENIVKRVGLTREMAMQRILPHITQILWFIVIISCFLGISMMPAKYMGTTKDRRHQQEHRPPGDICPQYHVRPPMGSIAMYDPSQFDEFPRRTNIHDRHNRLLMNNHSDPQTFIDSFLHPMLPRDYISRIPVPQGAVEDPGLQYPWQTPARWVYPAGVNSVDPKTGPGIARGDMQEPGDPPIHGIPRMADEACLRRSDIPWEPHKTKTYIKAGMHEKHGGQHVHIKHIHELSKPQKLWDHPVSMVGTISVVRAKQGSPEVKKNKIGVEFNVMLSDREVYETIFMHKVGNGTVILSTFGAYEPKETCLEVRIVITIPPQIKIPSLTISSLTFPVMVHRDVSFEAERFNLFAKKGSIECASRNITVSDSVVLGVQDGTIIGHYPLANSLQADCNNGLINITTQVTTNTSDKQLNNDPVITTSIGTGALKFNLEGPIPPDRLEIRSSHVTARGSQRISYPPDWQGVISGQGQVGTCNIQGPGVEIVESRNNNRALNVYVKAVKGPRKYDGADTSIELREGPVEVRIGDHDGMHLRVGSWGINTDTMSGIWNGFSVGLVVFFWVVTAMAGYGYLFG